LRRDGLRTGNEFIAFSGLRLGRQKGRAESARFLPSRLAAWVSAQVALQRCPILCPGAFSLARSGSHFLSDWLWAYVKETQRTWPPRKSGHFQPRFCGHFVPLLTRSIGADHVIDYKKVDFTQNGQKYDLILAVNGYHPISDYLRVLSPEGIYVVAGGSMIQLIQAGSQGRRISKTGSQKTYILSLVKNQKDLVFIKELLESGKVKPIVDICYPLNETSEALRYCEKVHPKGKVVITMEHCNKS
jgi:Zinc-binding dehydrogenase